MFSSAAFDPNFGQTSIGLRLQTIALDGGTEVVFYKSDDSSPVGLYYDGKLFVRSNIPTAEVIQAFEHEFAHHQLFVGNNQLDRLWQLVDLTSAEAGQIRRSYDAWLQQVGEPPLGDDRLKQELISYLVSADGSFRVDLSKAFRDPDQVMSNAIQYHAGKPLLARAAFGKKFPAPGRHDQTTAGSQPVTGGRLSQGVGQANLFDTSRRPNEYKQGYK